VNISNGGTVTAVTVTSAGTNYTSTPTATISVPTTAGGVQATFTFWMQLALTAPTITSGGSGYTVGDVLTFSGGVLGSGGYASTVTVSTVSAGVITGITITNYGAYTTVPTSPVSVTGGTGTGATFTPTWLVRSASPSPSITTAGSGYVEQPTVSFSGGGGSGAAAYATVGSDTTIKTLGSSLFLNHPNGSGLQIKDAGTTPAYPLFQSSGTTIQTYASGTSGTVGFQWATKGATNHSFATNSSVGNEQLRVSHTASAVNYVQVTGNTTANAPSITAQGSDSSVALILSSKGVGNISFWSSGSTYRQFLISGANNAVNYLQVAGTTSTNAPILSAQGSDTNIDLALTPKGTGRVKFGTYTGTVLSIAGYIEIVDSGGTVRKLAVVA
jgi:hypothetical protein